MQPLNSKQYRYLYILFMYLLFVPVALQASIRIDSVRATISSCANNGGLTVYASGTGSIFYSIVSGPVTQPVQTSNVFNSLPAGTYTVQATNATGEQASSTVTVGGNYRQPDFSPLATKPNCPGQSNGMLVGNLQTGTGNPPYSWELIAPSPEIRPAQLSDSFFNLAAGNYTMRVTDACGSFRTLVATISDPPPANLAFVITPRANMIGCDSVFINFLFKADSYHFPLTFTYSTTAGPVTTIVPNGIVSLDGLLEVTQLLPGVTFNDGISIMATDACGNSVSSPFYTTRPFFFCSSTSFNFSNCTYQTPVSFDLQGIGCYRPSDMYTGMKSPLRYEVINQVTGTLVDSATEPGYLDQNGNYFVSGFTLNSLVPDNTYTINITDGCGRSITQSYYAPVQVAPSPRIAEKTLYPDGCVDSVAFAFIFADNFGSVSKLVLLSGPQRVGSTKPGYAYESIYQYPDTIEPLGFGNTTVRFDIANFAPGTYHFKVVDTCGTELFDSLVVSPSDVTDLGHRFWYQKGCLGRNQLHFAIQSVNGYLNIVDAAGNTIFNRGYSGQNFRDSIADSLLNLPSGTYYLRFLYQPYFYTTTAANAQPVTCVELTDTIVIEGYQTPQVKVSNAIRCNNQIYIELLPDSSKGIVPYQYELIAGPQVFPVQQGNVFQVSQPGTYTARIYDVCGNGSTANITVDTLQFPPLLPLQTSCSSLQLSYGPSAFYQYTWTGPQGQQYTGDTLAINPVTTADTGLYIIKRITSINGCRDTATTSYRVSLPLTTFQNLSICNGQSVQVGSSIYNASGTYRDTLVSSIGCDSIVVLNLVVSPAKSDTINRSICQGQSFSFGGNQYSITGTYRDTIATSSCDSIVVLNLTVNPLKRDTINRSICQGQTFNFGSNQFNSAGTYRDTIATATCDSIVVLNLTVNPLKRDTINRSICQGQTFSFGGNQYSLSGTYRDTIATSTCDSIVLLNLTVNPLKRDTITRSICQGQSFIFGGNQYSITGTYRDTIATSSCDSIVVLNLTVNPLKRDTINRSICQGQTFSFGGNQYTSAGTYRDTIATATCDSIVVLNLTVNPLKRDTINRSICEGQTFSFGSNQYNSAGTYRDTIATSTCDSIVVLNLTVNPLKRDTINRSICQGQTFSFGGRQYNSTGTYRDTTATSTCDSIVVLNLTVNPLKRDTINRSICQGQSFAFGGNQYSLTGTYRDTIATITCDSIVVLNLQVLPPKTDSLFSTICQGDSIQVGNRFFTTAGVYTQVIAGNPCVSTVVLTLNVVTPPLIDITATPTVVAPGGVVQLGTTPAPSYNWSSTAALNNNNIQNPVAFVNQSAWIYLLVQSAGGECRLSDSIFITVLRPDSIPCNEGSFLYLPSAFTPDGNGRNDVFKIHYQNARLKQFDIYNRWGELVFATNNIASGWDGFYKGRHQPGSYVYVVTWHRCNTSTPVVTRGNVLLLR